MPKIRLANKEYAKYSSMLGPVQFKNGVSVESVDPMIIRRLGAITRVEVIDEEGNGRQAGATQEMADARSNKVAELKDVPPVGEHEAPSWPKPVQHKAPEKKTDELDEMATQLDEGVEDLNAAVDAVTEVTTDEPVEQVEPFTREDLEAIADEKGISGLREVAPEGVKSNRIEDLITKILEAQKEG